MRIEDVSRLCTSRDSSDDDGRVADGGFGVSFGASRQMTRSIQFWLSNWRGCVSSTVGSAACGA